MRVKRSASKAAFRKNIIAVYDRLRSKAPTRAVVGIRIDLWDHAYVYVRGNRCDLLVHVLLQINEKMNEKMQEKMNEKRFDRRDV